MIQIIGANGQTLIDGINPLMQLHSTQSWANAYTGVWNGGFAESVAVINVPISPYPVFHASRSPNGTFEWNSIAVYHPTTVYRFTSLPGIVSGAGNAGIQVFAADGIQVFDSRAPSLRLVSVINTLPTDPGGSAWSYPVSNEEPPPTGLSISGLPASSYQLWAPNMRYITRRQGTFMRLWREAVTSGPTGSFSQFHIAGTYTVPNVPAADGWQCSRLPRALVLNVFGLNP